MADTPAPVAGDPPPSWRHHLDGLLATLPVPPGRLVAGAAAVAGCAVIAILLFRGGPPPPPELTLPRAGAGGAEAFAVSSTTTALAAYVHVAGAVARPGLYRLGPGARVSDALDAAGGPRPDADVDLLNLAARVADGDRVYVPRKGESPPAGVVPGATVGASPPGPAPAPILDLNTATEEQLEDLPGVGPATAKAIVEYRTRRGRFRSVEELLEVRGIGEAKLADLRGRVRV